MAEEWRVVPGTDGRCEVSNLGNVRGVKRFTKRHQMTRDGYARATLSLGKGKGRHVYVHRLICAAFIGPIPDGYEVNHKDGNKTNNRPDNLEYVTRRENVRHSIDVLGKDIHKSINTGSAHGMAKLTEADVVQIRTMKESGATNVSIQKAFGLCAGSVSLIVNRKTWRHI